jgi:suppressor for copper-sensitivity B
MRRPFVFLGAAIIAALLSTSTKAQAPASLNLDNLKGGLPGVADTGPLVTVSAAFNVDDKSRHGRLAITAEVADEWHIFSITQAPGGPITSKIKLVTSDDYQLKGDFKPSPEPTIHVDNDVYKGLTIEEHIGTVTWSAPIELAAAVDPAKLKISGKLLVQSCSGSQCAPPQDLPFMATLDASLPAAIKQSPSSLTSTDNAEPAATGTYQVDDIVFHGYLSPSRVIPGGKLSLVIIAEPAAGWHIYELSAKPASSSTGSRPTLLVLTETSGLTNGPAVASEKPRQDPKNTLAFHDEAVTWTVEMAVPDNKQGPIKIAGLLGYQICTKDNCKRPDAISFSASATVGNSAVDGQVPLTFTAGDGYDDVAKRIKDPAATRNQRTLPPSAGNSKGTVLDPNQLKPASRPTSLASMICAAFVGGLIMNVMPCVLPVIGLKILSFIEQSGHSRRRAFLLNLWYSSGVFAVFMTLATLTVVVGLSMGELFSFDEFNIALAGIIFVMALSFLGVWEIPIPGFVGGAKAGQLAAKEGFSGAFAKGVITTVLGTSCIGPFLGVAMGFAAKQPPLVVYLIFSSSALGMASPYLLIGAFPRLFWFLPKPGEWMDTVKQTMGFVLLATVVYLMTLIQWPLMVPTLALLVGLWAGCWWIGRTPLYAELPQKLWAWGAATGFGGLTVITAFVWLAPIMQERFQRTVEREIASRGGSNQAARETAQGNTNRLPWRPFSLQDLVALTGEGKTVMVDFTADWCLNCKALEKFVLNTAQTKEFVTANGIVVMEADVTRYPPDETALLKKLNGGSRTVPVLAIFPAGRPNEPLVFNEPYTIGQLLEKLKEAGPSKGSAQVAELTALNTP